MLQGQFFPSNLVISEPITREVTIQSGQNLKTGSVLGLVRYACPTTGTAGTNTGNGTVTLVKPGSKVKIGTYTITCLYAASHGGTFRVTDPDGLVLGTIAITAGAGQVADFHSEQIMFRITDGSTDFVAADAFTIAVTGNVPSTVAVVGTGNGIITEVQPRSKIAVGNYVIKCIEKITNGGKFSVTSPSGADLGVAYAGKYTGTGNGTLTNVAAGPRLKRNGGYSIKCIATEAHGGTFRVTDPDGVVIGTVAITAGSGNSANFNSDHISFRVTDGSTDFALNDEFIVFPFENDHIAFRLVDGSTDFEVNDTFTLAVTIGGTQCRLVNAANLDGSQDPYAILGQDVDATVVATRAAGFVGGVFNERALVFGGKDTIETHRVRMREMGLFTQISQRAE